MMEIQDASEPSRFGFKEARTKSTGRVWNRRQLTNLLYNNGISLDDSEQIHEFKSLFEKSERALSIIELGFQAKERK